MQLIKNELNVLYGKYHQVFSIKSDLSSLNKGAIYLIVVNILATNYNVVIHAVETSGSAIQNSWNLDQWEPRLLYLQARSC